MAKSIPTLKSQDILILAKIIVLEDPGGSLQKELAESLGISRPEVSNALKRLRSVGLLSDSGAHVKKLAAIEFFKHAVKFMFPIKYSGLDRGILAGPSADFVKEKVIYSDEVDLIWPDPSGKHRGLCVPPIYPTAVQAAKKDKKLYRLLTLIDLFRGLGSTRHLQVGSVWLSEIIKGRS